MFGKCPDGNQLQPARCDFLRATTRLAGMKNHAMGEAATKGISDANGIFKEVEHNDLSISEDALPSLAF